MRWNPTPSWVLLFVSAVVSDPLRERDQVADLVKPHTKSTSGVGQHAWAGAYYWNANDAAGQEAFEFATATFTFPPQQNTSNSYAIEVSINNITDAIGGAIVILNGIPSYAGAWSDLDPFYLSPIDIAAGNVVRASINMSSACVLLENLTNGESDVYYFNPSRLLLGKYHGVLWAVQPINGGTLPFGTVTIKNAMAYGPSNKIYKAEGASIQDLSDGGIVAEATTNGASVIIECTE